MQGEAVGVGREEAAEVVALPLGRRGAQRGEESGGRGEARAADATGLGGEVAEHAEGGAARRDRLFDPPLQEVQG